MSKQAPAGCDSDSRQEQEYHSDRGKDRLNKLRNVGWKQPRAAQGDEDEPGNEAQCRNCQPENTQQANVPGDPALPGHEWSCSEGFAAPGTKRGRSVDLSPAAVTKHIEASLPVP